MEAATLHPCRVNLPADYDRAQEYPLVVGLHGFGGNADMFSTLWYAFDRPEFIYATPQAPYILPEFSGFGYSWLAPEGASIETQLRMRQLTLDYVQGVVDELKSRHRVSEVYVLGFSQGCAIAYALAFSRAGEYAGVTCFAGPFPQGWLNGEHLEAARAAGLRVFIAQGTEDAPDIIGMSQDARELLTAQGLAVEYVEFPAGHTLPREMLRQAQMWMLQPHQPFSGRIE